MTRKSSSKKYSKMRLFHRRTKGKNLNLSDDYKVAEGAHSLEKAVDHFAGFAVSQDLSRLKGRHSDA